MPRYPLQKLALPLAGFVLALLAGTACRVAAGASLGFFIGGVAFTAMGVPPLVGGAKSTACRLLIPCTITLGIALAWLWAIGRHVMPAQWLACSADLLAFALALGGFCSLLLAMRFNPALAAATVTTLALLWLTWPVWLSHALLGPAGDAIVAWLVPAHPLFAINGVLAHFDTWDRYPLAYSRLTVLNQDVFYALPPGIFWTTLLHLTLAAITFALSLAAKDRAQSANGSTRLRTATESE